MAAKKTSGKKRYYTVTQANAALPLVRSIVKDITLLACDLRERHERLSRLQPPDRGLVGKAHEEELHRAHEEFERDQERMREYEVELEKLGIELKDYFAGLIDFPCLMKNREVCLCWRLDEAEVAHWHEVDAGFAGRQKLKMDLTMK